MLKTDGVRCPRVTARYPLDKWLTSPKGTAYRLVFPDPPYHQNLVQAAVTKLTEL